jgi:[ribosomal protein S5]-alanine N-acetyltransferase
MTKKQTALIKSHNNCELRKLSNSDAFILAQLANDRSIWLNVRDTFPFPYEFSHAIEFITQMNNNEKAWVWGIFSQEMLVGVIGVHFQDDVYRFSAELGYWIGSEFRGKGLASAAVAAIVNHLFTHTVVNRVYAGVFDFNPASKSVLEKNDFVCEGTKRKAVFKDDKFLDELIYARLKD